MRRVLAAGMMMTAVLWTASAAGQTPSTPQASTASTVKSWYIGANTGAAVVENFSAVVGAEGGKRFWKNLDLVGEIAWVQDAVSRRQLDKVDTLARSIADSQHGTASSDMRVPTLYGGLGGRWVLEQSGKFRPYFLVTIGAAKVNLKPTIGLNGTDVTSSAATYGVTLGQDVIGKYNHFATEGGIGVLMSFGEWYADGGARLLSISSDQRTNIARIVIGGGYTF
jgi:hypothetical protein